MKPEMATSRTVLGYAVALNQRGSLWWTRSGPGSTADRVFFRCRDDAARMAAEMRPRAPAARVVVVHRVVHRDALELFREALRTTSPIVPAMPFPSYMRHGPRAEVAAGVVVRAAVELAEAELTGKDTAKALRGVVRAAKTYIRALQAERDRPA